MDTINMTPTPEGLAHSVKLFEQQIVRSEQIIEQAERWLEKLPATPTARLFAADIALFEAALEALQEQERQRIKDMREGIDAARGATQGEEDDARALCLKAGRDPDEVITKYVMEDLAAVLIDGADIGPERIVAILRKADTKTLGEAVSTEWLQVFEDYADEIEDPAPCS